MSHPSLTIHLFGPLRILLQGEPMPRVRTRSVEWLLALLVLRHGRTVERSWLAGTLWPESREEQALHNLRDDLMHLRKALGSERDRLQSPSRNTLTLVLAGAEVDVVTFDAAIKAGDEGSLQSAVAVCTGLLLEGWYEEWVSVERESRQQACLSALETLAERAAEQSNHPEAIRYLRQAETLDPLRDSVARLLMTSLGATGDLGAVVEVYRHFRNRLYEELAVAPDAETTQLFQALRAAAKEGTRVSGVGYRVSKKSSESRPTPDTQYPTPGASPYALTPLIGREAAVETLRERLTQNRLVTLVGAGRLMIDEGAAALLEFG